MLVQRLIIASRALLNGRVKMQSKQSYPDPTDSNSQALKYTGKICKSRKLLKPHACKREKYYHGYSAYP